MFVGVNLTAIYQDDELTDKETFQVEFEKRTDQWRLRTADDTYWILVESGSGIQTNGNARYSLPYSAFVCDRRYGNNIGAQTSHTLTSIQFAFKSGISLTCGPQKQ